MRDQAKLSEKAVLIVEDDPLQIRVLQAMTRKLGVPSFVATNVEQARALLESAEIRTVLLDLQLGEEAGLDILGDVAQGESPRSLIFTSGCDERTRTAATRLAYAHGVHVAGSLGKPIRIEELACLLDLMPTCAWLPTAKEPPRVTESDLITALNAGQITAEFQPKISLATGIPNGVEALARWRSPVHGNIPPDVFIPLASKAGKMRVLTEAIMRASLEACARWQTIFANVSVAVNVSPHLVDQELSETIVRLLEEAHVPASSLILEITESCVLGDSLSVSDTLTRLRIAGVQLSIDDFGTGHSSLVSLLRMPFNELKLDRLFVSAASHDRDAERILRSLIALSKEMGLRSVAEGIETEEVRMQLQDFGCDVGQGWFWAPALREDNLLAWLTARRDLVATGIRINDSLDRSLLS